MVAEACKINELNDNENNKMFDNDWSIYIKGNV